MLIRGVPDSQLAVAVGPPAPDAAVDLYGARVVRSRSDGEALAICKTIQRVRGGAVSH